MELYKWMHCSFPQLKAEFEVWVVYNEVQIVALDRNLLTRRTKRRWNVFYRYFNMNGAKINFDIRSICSVCYLWWKFTLWLSMRVLSEMKLIECWFWRVHSSSPPSTPAILICIQSNSNKRHTEQSANECFLTVEQPRTVRVPEIHAARTTHYARVTSCLHLRQYANLPQIHITNVQGLWVSLTKEIFLDVIEAYGGKWHIVPVILSLGFMWRWWVNSTLFSARTQVLTEKRAEWAPELVYTPLGHRK